MSILGNILWFICGNLTGRRAFFCEFKRIGRKDV